jgi:catechol 2,3-dioxygenase-like lactoylglutathione lyase family enzyme
MGQVALLVRDYDEAIDFYCAKLGFLVVEDTQLRDGKRWVRLRASGDLGSEILLSKVTDEKQNVSVGNQAGGRVLFFFYCDNFEDDYKDLLSKGVQFLEGPRNEKYGKVAVFRDLYGNRIDLIESKVNANRATTQNDDLKSVDTV